MEALFRQLLLGVGNIDVGVGRTTEALLPSLVVQRRLQPGLIPSPHVEVEANVDATRRCAFNERNGEGRGSHSGGSEVD